MLSNLQKEKLLTEQKDSFNKQLEVLAVPLRGLFDQTTKTYSGIFYEESFTLTFSDDDEEEPVTEPGTSTLPKAMKHKTAAPLETSSEKHRVLGKRSGICKLSDATPLYPTVVDKKRYLHTGVEKEFCSSRKSSAVGK